MDLHAESPRRVGVAVVGLGGAVATTAVAGVELIKAGAATTKGLPLADVAPELVGGLAGYDQLVFSGWDLYAEHLHKAAGQHNVLTPEQLAAAEPSLSQITPWPAVGSRQFCRNVDGENHVVAETHREAVAAIRADLRRFRDQQGLDGLVMINLASTERSVDLSKPVYNTPAAFEQGLDSHSPDIGPAMLYAYAAIMEHVPYVNFTPSVAADVPALIALAEREGVPLAGKDGKTGQTMLKTVVASALRSRALHVDGWFSTNILGNRDGMALADSDSLQSKLTTKASVIDQILGYKVEDHVVHIHYYRPRGDNKEAWDNIDISGFLGQPMQIKINFLCRDSVLAAPLVIELARLMDFAQQSGERGVQEQMGAFFKAPMVAEAGKIPEHALHLQEQRLFAWLAGAQERVTNERAVGGFGDD